MTDKLGRVLKEKDTVVFPSGKVSKIMKFEFINERAFAVVLLKGGEAGKLWISTSASTKLV